MGGMVLKLPIGTKGQNEIYVDTYKLPNGIYIYSLVTEKCPETGLYPRFALLLQHD